MIENISNNPKDINCRGEKFIAKMNRKMVS
jgi:hypothetical protein